ncbi:unnamed protein product [Auanema sp. JU1783]|nr:unnamed protein product [Auanema sp. JU1783]
MQYKDHTGNRKRYISGSERNHYTHQELKDNNCRESAQSYDWDNSFGGFDNRWDDEVEQRSTYSSRSCSSLGYKKRFDYDVWLSEQIRVTERVVQITNNEYSTMKKLTKSRLQPNFRYTKEPVRSVDYINKIRFCSASGAINEVNEKYDLVDLVSSPEFHKEAQSWKGIKQLKVGRTFIEKSLAKFKHGFSKSSTQIYNDICVLDESRRTDPLKQAIFFVQSNKYCQEDIDYFYESMVNPVQKELYDSEIVLEVPDAKYSISLKAGGVGHINGYPVCDDLSCIHVSNEELDEVYSKLLGTIDGFVSLAKIPKMEIERYLDMNGTQLPDSCYHVFFSSQKHCLSARKNHKDMMPYLVCDNMIGHSQSIELAMDIRWYVRPFQGRARLTIRNPDELIFTIEVLKLHNINAEFLIEDDRTVYDQLDLKWGGGLRDTAAHDEKVFATIIRKALRLNRISIKDFTMERENARYYSKRHLVRRIHQRLVRAAINSDCWNRKIPIEDEDWYELFDDSQSLPWHITIGHEFPFQECLEGYASIVFTDNFEMAEKLMCFLLERSPDKDTFTLNPMDKLGARFFPCYRSFRYMPLNIRAACHTKILELDEKWRTQSDSDHFNWLRLRDHGTNREECRLTVEGWPIKSVIAASKVLDEMCKGLVIDCSSEGREVLFTDFGDAFVYNLNDKYNGAIVFLVDRLNMKITLYGDDIKTRNIVEQLLLFVENWHNYFIETPLVIDRPRYFPQLKNTICNLSCSATDEKNGGGRFWPLSDSTHLFRGEIHSFLELVDLLETLQDTVEDVYFNKRSFRPICPVCFMKVDMFCNYQLSICGDYYCLPCLARMIKHYIQSRELPIACCEPSCQVPIAVEDIMFLLIGNMKMPTRFVYEKFQPLIQSILDVNLVMNPHLKPCSTPDCIGINVLSSIPGSTCVCSRCGAIRCGQCCENVHDGFSCEYYKKIAGDVQLSISEFKKSKGKSVRDCPNILCQAVIEKSAGCNHMQCHYCRTHFCWLCHYCSDCQKNVYIHLNEVHGGAGGGWRVENNMIVEFPDDIAEDVLIAAALENAQEL